MKNKPVPELLVHTLKTYCNVNAYSNDWLERLNRYLRTPQFPERNNQFRNQLAEAILCRTITPNQYEHLTGEDFDTPEDLEEWLRELWTHLYGAEPIDLPSR